MINQFKIDLKNFHIEILEIIDEYYENTINEIEDKFENFEKTIIKKIQERKEVASSDKNKIKTIPRIQ